MNSSVANTTCEYRCDFGVYKNFFVTKRMLEIMYQFLIFISYLYAPLGFHVFFFFYSCHFTASKSTFYAPLNYLYFKCSYLLILLSFPQPAAPGLSQTPPSSPRTAQKAGHRRIQSDVTHSAMFGVPVSQSTQQLQAATAEASLNKSKWEI